MSVQDTINITLEVWRQNGPQDQRGLSDPEDTQKAKPVLVQTDQCNGQEHHHRQDSSDSDMRRGGKRHRQEAEEV